MAASEARDEAADGQSSSLEAAVAARDAQLGAQAAQLARLSEQVGERDATIAAQAAQLAKLTEQVAELKELLGRNSSNSHLPPCCTNIHPTRYAASFV